MKNYDNDFNNYEGQPNHEVNSKFGRGYDNEFATDFLSNDHLIHDATTGANISGIVGIIASLAALTVYPLILGSIAVALGAFSVSKGNKTLGYTSIGIGLLAVATSFILTGPILSIF